MKSINTLITNIIMHDLARVRKSCEVLHHTAASSKLYILTDSLYKYSTIFPSKKSKKFVIAIYQT